MITNASLNLGAILSADEMLLAADRENFSLYTGFAGKILLHYSLNKYAGYEFEIEEEVNYLIEVLQMYPINYFPFAGGVSGTIWLLHYLQEKQAISLEEDFFDEINPELEQAASDYLKDGKYDFMHGAGGIILCLLRQPEKNRAVLEGLTQQLLDVRVEIRGHNVWLYTGYEEKKDYNYKISLGLSHGLPSMMVLLSKLFAAGILPDQCKEAIKETYSFLESESNSKITADLYSFYPAVITDTSSNIYAARLGWCYGDLGVANAFYTAGKNIDDDELLKKGEMLYDYYASFTNEPKYGINDCSFCHGAAGMVHLFRRMYYNTNKISFLNASEYWLDVLLKMNYHEDAIAGYKYLAGEEGWKVNNTLLEGTTGAALALVPYSKGNNPDWDECFLLS